MKTVVDGKNEGILKCDERGSVFIFDKERITKKFENDIVESITEVANFIAYMQMDKRFTPSEKNLLEREPRKDGRVFEADESYIRGYNAGLKSAWHVLMTLTEYFGNPPTPTHEFPAPDDILETIKKIGDESEGLPEKFC